MNLNRKYLLLLTALFPIALTIGTVITCIAYKISDIMGEVNLDGVKYIHFSVDDSNNIFEDLTVNAEGVYDDL